VNGGEIVAAVGLSMFTGAIGYVASQWQARSGARDEARATASREQTREEHVRRIESRVAELEQERLWMRDLTLGGVSQTPPSGRARRTDLSALTALVRGLAGIEETCITDGDGLSHSDASTDRAGDLAVFGAAVLGFEKRVAAELGPVVEARVATTDASHVTARPLRGWADGFAVVASAISRAPNPMALNAVSSSIALATAGRPSLPKARSPRVVGARAVGPRVLVDELSRLASSDISFADYRAPNGVAATWVDERSDVAPAQETLRRLDELAARAGRALRGGELLRLDVVLLGRTTLTWATSPDGAERIVVVSRARDVDDALLTRLLGRLLRVAPATGAEAA
jgi:hypothetical protein